MTVILTDEEHGKLKLAAGLVPLSAWVKRAALLAVDKVPGGFTETVSSREPTGRNEEGAAIPPVTEKRVVRRNGGIVGKIEDMTHETGRRLLNATGSECKHGTKKGCHCWQCGGLAVVGESKRGSGNG
jgi:hypothetical protein